MLATRHHFTPQTHFFSRLGSMLTPALVIVTLLAALASIPANGAASAGGAPSGQLQLDGGKPFPVLSCSLAVAAESSWTKGGGVSVGKPNPEPIRFTKEVDANSITLLKKITTGTSFASAKFTATSGTGAGATTVIYELTGLFVTSLTHVGSGGAPLEEVSFVYKTLAWKFIDANGTETTGRWDIPAGTFE
jgi:type VI secretion system secreted protein Hcp